MGDSPHSCQRVQCVVLVHELDSGDWHYDWLLESPQFAGDGHAAGSDAQADVRTDERTLIAFRVSQNPAQPGVTAFFAQRLPDHRTVYLTFEGEISGGRGRVRRVWEGTATVFRDDHVFAATLDGVSDTGGSGDACWVGTRRGFELAEYDFVLSSLPEIGHTGGVKSEW